MQFLHFVGVINFLFFFFLVESCSVLGIEKVDVFGSFDTYPCSFSLGQSS